MIAREVGRTRVVAPLLSTVLVAWFAAACESPQPPASCGAMPQVTIHVGETSVVSACFNDPNEDMLTYSVSSSNSSVATASISVTSITVRAVAPGSASITVTATDPGGLQGQQSFQVTVPNRAPQAKGAIPPITVPHGRTGTVNASSYFTEPDGQALTYNAASSNPGVASVSVSGSTVTARGVAKGSATVTVTAADPEGLSATQTFLVTVPNRAPESVGTIADIEVEVDSSAVVDVAANFTDPDGDRLTYAAASSSTTRVGVSVSGSMVTVTGLSKGGATVTVTAADPEGLTARQTFEVTVPNRAPKSLGTIPDVEVEVDSSAVVDVAAHFTDPDGDRLTYAAASSSTTRVGVSVSGSMVTVTGLSKGGATVTVTAADPEGLTARQTFEVTVPNRAPKSLGTIPDVEVEVDSSAVVDVAAHFTDPDGDRLTYAAASSSTTRVGVSVSGSVVTVTGLSKGGATVTVTAADPEGLTARQTFEVTVPNRAPKSLGTIPDIEVEVDSSAVVDVAAYFTDPDGDRLTYSAASSNSAVANVSVSGSAMRVTPVAAGNATVTVTARDQDDLAARQQASVTVTSPDRAALVALYNATDGPNWVNDENWLTDSPLREWYGVDTDDSGRVVSLDLSGQWDQEAEEYVRHGLSGPIPPELGNLSGLTELSLRANELEGAIPPELGNLANLTVLSLHTNRLTGAIPPELGNLANLTVLSLRSNRLTGAIPPELGNLANLRSLSLGYNDLTGPIPPELGNLANLTVLRLNVNDLTGPIPPELDNLANLTVLWLSNNRLTGAIPPELGNLANVTELLLGVNDLTGAIPPELGNLANLRWLYLGRNNLTGQIPPGLGNLANLTVLTLDSNDLTGPIPPELGNLANLTWLILRSNDLTGPIPPELGNLANLTELTLSDNNLSGPIPPELGNLSRLKSLRLSENPALADTIPLGYRRLSLRAFYWNDTGLCSPDDSSFQAWLDSIEDHEGGPVCRENRAPEAVGSIPDQTMTEGDTVSLDVEDYFSDPDGDDLTYSVDSSRPSVATGSMSGSTLTVVAVAAGTATMTVTATDTGDLSATQTFRVTVSASESFDMEMRFTSSVSSTVRSHVSDARDEWEAVLEDTELDDIAVNRTLNCHGISRFVGTVDDHLIFVHVDSIDGEGGVLAYAGFCYFRSADSSPLLSATWIDEADVEKMTDLDALVPVMFHEMAHALGFSGGHWDRLDLLEKGSDAHFTGELAIEAFDEAGGEDYDGEKVPVQLKVYSHWRKSVFGNEIMSPTIDLENDEVPISAITLQAMADAGYKVDVSRADDYELPSSDDIQARRRTGRVFDLSNDVLWGPITVLDADGRVIRVIPPPPGSVRWPLPRREVHIEPRRPPGRGGAPPPSPDDPPVPEEES